MSEKLNINIEKHNSSPEADRPKVETRHESEKKHHEKDHKPSEKEKQEKLQALRQEISQEATPLNREKVSDSTEKSPTQQGPINKELKNMMRIRTLTRIRKELKAPDKALSKVIHSKPVETVSAIGEKTIARPAGILGGGLIALIGSLVVLYMAKHYGFRYNLLLFIMLFVSGYVLATLFELLAGLLRKIKN